MNEDHPRVCGKNSLEDFTIPTQPGSPPRVREKRSNVVSNFTLLRITPACAGKTKPMKKRLCQHQDHPRVCGKNKIGRTVERPTPGSPPRVREKPTSNEANARWSGITPACAGKTDRNVIRYVGGRDHPRVCGKNSIPAFGNAMTAGSPPRVREKPVFKNGVGRSTGITPACAGKTAF